MRRRYGITFLLLLTAALTTQVPQVRAQAPTFFTAHLTPAQEPGGVESEGSGTAALVLTDEGLRFYITVHGLTSEITNAHFHRAEIGVNGGVVRDLLDHFSGNTATGIWTPSDPQALADSLVQALMLGELYINVHTQNFPGGEIRGQVLPSSGASLSAFLTPAQAGVDIESDGSGTAHVQVTPAGAIYYITVDGLTGPAMNAHFHIGNIGESGTVVRGIFDNWENGTAFGVWTANDAEPLTDELRETLLSGGLYFNVHTAAYGAGEIRGQILPSSGWGFSAALDAEQQSAEVESDAMGTGTFTLTDAGLIYHITVDGLTSDRTNAHFHRAPAGEDGGVVHGINDNFVGDTAFGVWSPNDDEPLTPELIQDLYAGNIYVNVHTQNYGPGEIRGQVLLREGTEFTARLSPAQEPGGVDSDGAGTAAMTLTDEGLQFRVTVSGLTSDKVNAHFHRAPAGTNGSVVRGINDEFVGLTAEGTWTASDGEPLTEELIQALMLGELYLNIHTTDNPGGEIRGQVLPSEGVGLRAVYTNEQEFADIEQDGNGVATLTLTEHGLIYHTTVTNLTGDHTNAHFHGGAIGVSGGVIHGIHDNFVGNSARGVWRATGDGMLTAENISDLVSGDLYLNVHTAANGPGEIRGQVLLSSGIGATVPMDPEQEGGDIESDGAGTAAVTLTEGGVAYALTASDLTGPIMNAHFHNAPLGENGGVVRSLFDEFQGNTVVGFWSPTDPEPFTSDMRHELLAGNLYFNLHTQMYGAGEIRGQIMPNEVLPTAIEPIDGEVPGAYRLDENYPNPFNPATTIEFALVKASQARLEVFDVLGRHVVTLVDGPLSAGEYRVQFEGAGLPSGIYMYRLTTPEFQSTRTMLLLK